MPFSDGERIVLSLRLSCRAANVASSLGREMDGGFGDAVRCASVSVAFVRFSLIGYGGSDDGEGDVSGYGGGGGGTCG